MWLYVGRGTAAHHEQDDYRRRLAKSSVLLVRMLYIITVYNNLEKSMNGTKTADTII
jgi:hypothetical protein